jgi:hypothetical protein
MVCSSRGPVVGPTQRRSRVEFAPLVLDQLPEELSPRGTLLGRRRAPHLPRKLQERVHGPGAPHKGQQILGDVLNTSNQPRKCSKERWSMEKTHELSVRTGFTLPHSNSTASIIWVPDASRTCMQAFGHKEGGSVDVSRTQISAQKVHKLRCAGDQRKNPQGTTKTVPENHRQQSGHTLIPRSESW